MIAASAATMAITFLGMVFTQLEFSKRLGRCWESRAAVVFFAKAVTLLPALMVLTGRRLDRARRPSPARRSSGVHIVRRPKTHRQRAGAGYSGRLRRTGPNYDDHKDASGFCRVSASGMPRWTSISRLA